MRDGITRFAWLPVKLENGESIWLKKYIAFYDVVEDTEFGSEGYLLIPRFLNNNSPPMCKNYSTEDAVMLKLRG
jgi:hypothetical protein